MPTYNAGEARLAVVPDASEFKRKLEADMRKIRAEFALHVTADTAQARADVDRFREQQQRNGIQIGVDAVVAKAEAELERFRKSESSKTVKPDVDPQLSRAEVELARFRKAQELRAIRVQIEFDEASALGKLRLIRKEFDGVGGKLLSGSLWNTGALAVGSLPAMATVLGEVTAAVQQVSQAGLALPGVLAGITGSVGTAALGFSGMKDAIEAVNKSADGTAASLKKADAAMKTLAPNAAEVVKTIVGLKPAFDSLRGDVQQKMFAGISDNIKTLADNDLPVLQRGLGGIATVWNGTLKQLTTSLGSESSRSLLDRILGNTADAQSRLTKAIDPLVHGIGTLSAAGTDALPRLSDGVGKLSDRFDKFITSADADGRLSKWINDGITGLGHLGETFLNIGKSVTAVTTALGGGEGLLGALDQGSGKLQEFLNSDRGQAMLTKFFTDGKEQLIRWFDILKNVGATLGDVYSAAKKWSDVLLPALQGVTGVLSKMGPLVEAVGTAFLTWKSVSGITALIDNLRSVRQLLGGIATDASTAGTAIGNAGAGPAATAGARGGWRGALSRLPGAIPGLAIGATGAISNAADPNGGSALTTIGGFTLGGAELAGPAGAAAGAIAGGIVSLAPVIVDAFKKEAEAQAAKGKPAEGTGNTHSPATQALLPGAAVQPQVGVENTQKTSGGPVSVMDLLGGSPSAAAKATSQTVDELAQNARNAEANVRLLATGISTLPTGEVVLKDPTPDIIDRVKQLGYDVKSLPGGQLQITVIYRDQNGNPVDPSQLRVSQRQLSATAGNEGPRYGTTVPARAGGGVAGRTADGRLWGPGTPTSDSILGVDAAGMPTAFVSTGEGVVNHAAMQRPGVAELVARLNGYSGGGIVDQYGNPVSAGPPPGGPASVAPAPDQGGGGVLSAMGSFLSGAQSSLGMALNLGQGLANAGGQGIPGLQTEHGSGTLAAAAGAAPSFADRMAGTPGLFGLFGSLFSSDPSTNVMNWGEQTAQWLGNFTAKTVGGFATSLWQGALGLVGLDNSILSPNNPWNQSGQSIGQFAFSSDGPLGKMLGANPGAGASSGKKGPTDKQIREANDRITDRDNAVAAAQKRLAELPANAKDSTRQSALNSYDKAVREAAEARDDLQSLMSGSTVTSATKTPAGLSGNQGAAYQAMLDAGFSGSEWSALENILNKESGFNPAARNPSSGAFGMFQFLGHENDKYGALGAYSSDPARQSAAGLQYIKDRYGSPSNAWAFWQANGWYENGGPTPPGRSTAYPSVLHGDEYVISARGRATVPDSFLHALNTGQVDASMIPHFAAGTNGPIPQGAVVPPPRPNFQQGKQFQPMQPRPAASVAPAPAPAGPASPAPPAPSSPQQSRPASVAPVAPGPTSTSGDAYNHNLAAINTGIDSGAAAVGQAIATGIGIASMGAGAAGVPGAGALGGLGSYAAGLAQQGGKILKDVVNVGSSFLVGSVPGSFGTQDNAYGETLRPLQNVPATAEYYGGNRTYTFNGIDGRRIVDDLRLQGQVEAQAAYAQWG